MDENVCSADLILPILFVTASASITVTATSKDVEHELIYSATQATAAIVDSVSHEVGVSFDDSVRKQIAESLDITKTYVSEIELSFMGIKFRIKRSPKKIIKNFTEEGNK